MVVVKAKDRDAYKDGVRITYDIKHAQRYKSVATAKAAMKAMGWDVERYDYVEVEE